MASSAASAPSEAANGSNNPIPNDNTTASATPTTAPPPPASGIPYVGSKISLISKSRIRYVGTLYTIDTKESTVALKDVKSYGTEDRVREGGPIPPSDQVYAYIIFRGPDILDLQFLSTGAEEENKTPASSSSSHQTSQPAATAAPTSVAMDKTAPVSTSPSDADTSKDKSGREYNKPVQPSARVTSTTSAPAYSSPSSGAMTSQGGRPDASVTKPTSYPPASSSSQPLGNTSRSRAPMPVRGPTPRAWGPPPGVPTDSRLEGSIPNAAPIEGTVTKVEKDIVGSNGSNNNEGVINPHPTGNGNIGNIHMNGRDGGGHRPRGRGKAGSRGWRRGPGIKIPDEDFDFESMNEKFEKAGLGDTEEELPNVEVRYDKSKSFFDGLVPEKDMRSELNAAQRRATDFETFGETRAYRPPRTYRGRGRRGGRGGGRGRRAHSHMHQNGSGRENGYGAPRGYRRETTTNTRDE